MTGTGTYLDALPGGITEVEESDVLIEGRRMNERTPVPFPSDPPAGYESWRAFFAEAKAAKAAVAIEEEPIEVLASGVGLPSALGSSPKRILGKAEQLGWKTDVRFARLRRPATLYVNDSDEHSRGDVRYPEKRETMWFVSAAHPTAVLGFRSVWVESETRRNASDGPKRPLKSRIPARLLELEAAGWPILVEGPVWEHEVVGTSFKFDSARACDPAGVPIELFYDYTPSKDVLKPLVNADKERMQTAAVRQDGEYNDGADYLERNPHFKKGGEFDAWLDEWTEILSTTKPKEEQAA